MQERRRTIRVSHFCRAQYCPSDDLVPRDGRITTLSEGGAGVLLRDVHAEGGRVTVSFSLPGSEEPLTATGTVRWRGAQLPKGGWYPLGMEWLPLEEAACNRLTRFLYGHPQVSSARARAAVSRLPSQRSARQIRIPALMGLVLACSAAAVASLWMFSLMRENRQLWNTVQRRNLTIELLEQQDSKLRDELNTSKRHLASTTSEVARLDQQAQLLGGEISRLSEDVERFQESYVRVREEREQLMQRVLDLDHERTGLTKRLATLEQVQLVVREAIEARLQPIRIAGEAPPRQPHDVLLGNRGYLIRRGQPTDQRQAIRIRVHEPQPDRSE